MIVLINHLPRSFILNFLVEYVFFLMELPPQCALARFPRCARAAKQPNGPVGHLALPTWMCPNRHSTKPYNKQYDRECNREYYKYIYIYRDIYTGCARLNVTTHKWHTRVCCAELSDIRTYTTARLSHIRMDTRYLVPSTWYQVLGI